MSIANNSLLRRIVEEVRDGPVPSAWEPPERRESEAQVLELRRSSVVHQAPFATSLHFWAHALRAFLLDRGRPEIFEALAANCLCEAVDGAQIHTALHELLQRVSPPLVIAPADYRGAYRMIERPVLVSWVAERGDGFVALFWARSSWLAEAQPLSLESARDAD